MNLKSESNALFSECLVNGVTLIRVDKPGKAVYDYVAKKCEDCGSDDTYIAISTQIIPFKDHDKR